MIEQKLDSIFKDIFELTTLPNRSELRADSMEKWDSMMQLNLVTAMEDEFDIILSLEQAVEVISYESALEIIKELSRD